MRKERLYARLSVLVQESKFRMISPTQEPNFMPDSALEVHLGQRMIFCSMPEIIVAAFLLRAIAFPFAEICEPTYFAELNMNCGSSFSIKSELQIFLDISVTRCLTPWGVVLVTRRIRSSVYRAPRVVLAISGLACKKLTSSIETTIRAITCDRGLPCGMPIICRIMDLAPTPEQALSSSKRTTFNAVSKLIAKYFELIFSHLTSSDLKFSGIQRVLWGK